MKKMRILGSLFLCALLLVAAVFALPTQAEAATSGTCGRNLTWALDDEGTLIISGTGAMNDYLYEDSAPAPWYSSRADIKKVIIGEGVTSIGRMAFYNCVNMASVTIPNTVTSFSYGAFDNCTGLERVDITSSPS